jgi:hypothetical protein
MCSLMGLSQLDAGGEIDVGDFTGDAARGVELAPVVQLGRGTADLIPAPHKVASRLAVLLAVTVIPMVWLTRMVLNSETEVPLPTRIPSKRGSCLLPRHRV